MGAISGMRWALRGWPWYQYLQRAGGESRRGRRGSGVRVPAQLLPGEAPPRGTLERKRPWQAVQNWAKATNALRLLLVFIHTAQSWDVGRPESECELGWRGSLELKQVDWLRAEVVSPAEATKLGWRRGGRDTWQHLHGPQLVRELSEDWIPQLSPFPPFFFYLGRSQTIPIPFSLSQWFFRLPSWILSRRPSCFPTVTHNPTKVIVIVTLQFYHLRRWCSNSLKENRSTNPSCFFRSEVIRKTFR